MCIRDRSVIELNSGSIVSNVSKKLNSPIPILADLPGPKYRVGELKNNSLDLSTDDELFLNCGNSNKDELSVWPPGLHLDVKNGAVLLVDDGKKVKVGKPNISGTSVEAKVVAHKKDDKVIVFKKKRRKGYKVKNGHRQAITEIIIVTTASGIRSRSDFANTLILTSHFCTYKVSSLIMVHQYKI